ncbi:MAG: 2-haloalkanoic acid dehalogenase, partial [uncultured Frankineae bacterium]
AVRPHRDRLRRQRDPVRPRAHGGPLHRRRRPCHVGRHVVRLGPARRLRADRRRWAGEVRRDRGGGAAHDAHRPASRPGPGRCGGARHEGVHGAARPPRRAGRRPGAARGRVPAGDAVQRRRRRGAVAARARGTPRGVRGPAVRRGRRGLEAGPLGLRARRAVLRCPRAGAAAGGGAPVGPRRSGSRRHVGRVDRPVRLALSGLLHASHVDGAQPRGAAGRPQRL